MVRRKNPVHVSNITHLFEEMRRTRVYKKDVTGEWCSDIGYSNLMEPDDIDTALDNYFEAFPERALAGEVWEITPLGRPAERAVVERSFSTVSFRGQTGTYSPAEIQATTHHSRRKIRWVN